MASARTDHRGYFIDLEQVPHQGWRVAAITHRVNGRALSPPAFSYPDRETAAQYGRPQHHLRPFERAPATSAVHLKADIRLHANIRPGGPCADLCNAANYCLGLLGSPSPCEADRNNHYYFHLLGVAKRKTGDHDGAITPLRHACELNPKQANYWYALGKAYEDVGNFDAAKSAYEEALRVEPHYQKARRALNALNSKRTPVTK